MRKSDVVQWLATSLRDHLESSTLVSITDGAPHVDIAEDRDAVEGRPYPFVGITPVSNTPHERGIGTDITQPTAVNYSSGTVDSIDRTVTQTLRVTVTALTDGDRKLRSDLTEDIQHELGARVSTDEHPADITDIDVGEAAPSGRPSQFVYGDGIPIEIEYEYIRTDTDVIAAEEVNVDVDVGETADDPNAADAIDESV